MMLNSFSICLAPRANAVFVLRMPDIEHYTLSDFELRREGDARGAPVEPEQDLELLTARVAALRFAGDTERIEELMLGVVRR